MAIDEDYPQTLLEFNDRFLTEERRAGNICTSCVGLTGFIARVVAIRNIG